MRCHEALLHSAEILKLGSCLLIITPTASRFGLPFLRSITSNLTTPILTSQVGQLLEAQCRSVHEKESYCLRFIMTQRTNLEDNQVEFLLFETYQDRAAIDRHMKEEHFLVSECKPANDEDQERSCTTHEEAKTNISVGTRQDAQRGESSCEKAIHRVYTKCSWIRV